jgi:hypothetical protein
VAEALSWPALRRIASPKGAKGSGTVSRTVTVTAEPAAVQSPPGSQWISTLAFPAG